MPPGPDDEAQLVDDVAVRDVEAVLEVREGQEARKVLVEVSLAGREGVLAELDAHLRRRVVHHAVHAARRTRAAHARPPARRRALLLLLRRPSSDGRSSPTADAAADRPARRRVGAAAHPRDARLLLLCAWDAVLLLGGAVGRVGGDVGVGRGRSSAVRVLLLLGGLCAVRGRVEALPLVLLVLLGVRGLDRRGREALVLGRRRAAVRVGVGRGRLRGDVGRRVLRARVLERWRGSCC